MFYSKPFFIWRILIVFLILCLAFIEHLNAQVPVIISEHNKEQISNKGSTTLNLELELVGESSFSVAFWKIYDIALLAPNGVYDSNNPYALKLTYSQNLKSEQIANKSIELIADQGVENNELLKKWNTELASLIPNIEKGDELLGMKTDLGMDIYLNGLLFSRTNNTQLVTCFFDIWLSEDTSEPKLREKLLGQ